MANLQGSDVGLYIGTGKDMEPETHFSGMIDDVRILRLSSGRVLQPSSAAVDDSVTYTMIAQEGLAAWNLSALFCLPE